MYKIDVIMDILFKLKFTVFSVMNMSNSYWAIPICAEDEYKAEIVSLISQYIYMWMR